VTITSIGPAAAREVRGKPGRSSRRSRRSPSASRSGRIEWTADAPRDDAHVDAWNAWYTTYGNRPSGVAEQRAIVDEACREVGRDPDEIERTVAVFVRMPGATGARDFDRFAAPPLEGPPAVIAATLADFAHEGIGHVQLVVDPITPAGVGSLAPVLEALDRLG
jgi:hypothetical protein